MIDYEGYFSRHRWLGTASLESFHWQPLLCPAWMATQICDLIFRTERSWDMRLRHWDVRLRHCSSAYGEEKAFIALHYISFMVVPNHSQESKWTRNSFAYRLRCSHCALDLTQTEPGSNVCVLWQGRFSKPLSLQNLSTVI